MEVTDCPDTSVSSGSSSVAADTGNFGTGSFGFGLDWRFLFGCTSLRHTGAGCSVGNYCLLIATPLTFNGAGPLT